MADRLILPLPPDVAAALDAEADRRAVEGGNRRGPGATACRSAVVLDVLRAWLVDVGREVVVRRYEERVEVPRGDRAYRVEARKAPLVPEWASYGTAALDAAEERAAGLVRKGWEVRAEVELAAAVDGVTLGRWVHEAVEQRLRRAASSDKAEG